MVLRILRSQYGNSDVFPVGEVDSMYFDTPGLATYEECLNGSNVKRKFRVRSYGEAAAQLQIKEKRSMTVRKWKHNIEPVAGATSWAQLIETAASRKQHEKLSEIAAFSARYGKLDPVVRVRYLRHRFRAFDFRVTLDEQIRIDAGPGLRGTVTSQVRLPFAVLEVKTTSDRPYLPLFGLVKLKQVSFSKYAVGMALLYGEREVLNKYL